MIESRQFYVVLSIRNSYENSVPEKKGEKYLCYLFSGEVVLLRFTSDYFASTELAKCSQPLNNTRVMGASAPSKICI